MKALCIDGTNVEWIVKGETYEVEETSDPDYYRVPTLDTCYSKCRFEVVTESQSDDGTIKVKCIDASPSFRGDALVFDQIYEVKPKANSALYTINGKDWNKDRFELVLHGDVPVKVICIDADDHYLVEGKVYEIKRETDTFFYHLKNMPSTSPEIWMKNRFQLVETKNDTIKDKPMSKIKVKCINNEDRSGRSGTPLTIGEIYEVEPADTFTGLYTIGGWTWSEDRFEIVTTDIVTSETKELPTFKVRCIDRSCPDYLVYGKTYEVKQSRDADSWELLTPDEKGTAVPLYYKSRFEIINYEIPVEQPVTFKVKCIERNLPECLTYGKVYEAKKSDDDSFLIITSGDEVGNVNAQYSKTHFKTVSNENSIVVKCINAYTSVGFLVKDHFYEVKSEDSGYYRLEGSGREWFSSRFEVVTIETPEPSTPLKVKCIDASGSFLVQNQIYVVEKEKSGCYYLKGENLPRSPGRFEIVKPAEEKPTEPQITPPEIIPGLDLSFPKYDTPDDSFIKLYEELIDLSKKLALRAEQSTLAPEKKSDNPLLFLLTCIGAGAAASHYLQPTPTIKNKRTKSHEDQVR